MEVGNEVHEDGYVPVICGLSRTRFADLERAWEAVRHAKRPRVHTFIATSEIHMQYKLRMTRDQVRQLPANGTGPCCLGQHYAQREREREREREGGVWGSMGRG
jgi:hypothetical protein